MARNASLVCQIRSNIRCNPELSSTELASIFKQVRPLTKDLYCYFYGFFEECSPSLIKQFMIEQSITRQQILSVFHALPDIGEKAFFQEAIDCGQF